jgi:class 3 adenylate cyclase/tetratricopeptide (TPR) repeat protein
MSARAPQTVSVLMTDLVGSTAMADRVGPEVAEELRTEHFALLRGALERAGGIEVKNLGDGLMVVFSGAAQSLACAVAMQQAVEARNRRAEEKLGVRIGVSVGDATAEGGDYFGEPVVESSRLCAQAEGGQIIVNALVRQLAGSRDGHSFRSLGGLELKGLSEPVQAFELQWEPAAIVGIALPERLRELPATAYVGRVAELARLTELWGEAREGSIRVALIGGEAGVGKTRLSTHLALEVHGEGATVLYGRSDEDLGVPFQPWVQALGHVVKEAPQRVLDAHGELFGGDLARLIPALRKRVPDLPAPRESDPETERYLLYAAVAGLLEEAGRLEPLLVILDDLHWADSPTLSLLRHLVATGSSMRVMVVGTYRDSDLSRGHPLTALLADLHREQGVERIKLTGLDSEEVLALIEAVAGHELDQEGGALAREIMRETAGNPFFAGELLRHLIESGAFMQGNTGRWRLVGDAAGLGLPQSVREVVGRRVDRLGSDARTVLSGAAVIGRDFDVDLLLAVVDFPEVRLLDLLDEAVAASLLQENRDRPGRFTFTHALVEHTLCEDLGATRRARLHRQIAEALEELCGDEPGERLGELAGHWAAAVVSADRAKAIHYARRAAERALEQLAPAEAERWYRQALELHDQGLGGERSEGCELLIGLGEAQRQIGNPEFRETLLRAAELAQELGDADRLCRAVLANSRGWVSQMGAVDSERVRALVAADEALQDGDPRRARVLALLACELHFAGEPSRCRALASKAIELARAAGDPVVLAHTLNDASWAIWGADTLQEREQLTAELVEIARELDDPWLSFWVTTRSVMVGLEGGDRSQVESGIDTLRTLAASVPQPSIAFARLLFEACWALVQGELETTEQWVMRALVVGVESGEPDAVITSGALFVVIRLFQARIIEIVEQSVHLDGGHAALAAWQPLTVLAMIEGAHEDEARERALAEDLQKVPMDQTWSSVMFLWADVYGRLRMLDRAGELYELLEPYSRQLVVPGALAWGSVASALGTLAATLERYEQAEGHFAAAAAIEQRLGAPLFLARTHAGWARALVARRRPEDLDRAQQMLEQAQETAERLGAKGITREVAECRATLAAEWHLGRPGMPAGTRDEAVSELRTVLARADTVGSVWLGAWARVDLALALHRRGDSGDRDEARAVLAEVEQIAELNAMRWVREQAAVARDELDGRPQQPPATAGEHARPIRALAARTGRRALAAMVRGQGDEALERRFAEPRRQRALLRAVARAFQPAHSEGFCGVIAYELEPFAIEVPPGAPWRWAIEVDSKAGRARLVEPAPPEAALTIRAGLAEWVRVSAGVQDPITAMAAGRLRVEGDVTLLARLEAMFGAV